MPISELLVTEYDQEMANTRKALERVPGGKMGLEAAPQVGNAGMDGLAHRHVAAVSDNHGQHVGI